MVTLKFSDSTNTVLTKIINGVDVVIPETCTKIADGTHTDFVAYPSRYTLKSIILPSNLEYIGKYAFYFCPLLESLDISMCKKLTTMKSYAIALCKKLTDIKLPNSLYYFEEACLRDNNIELTLQIKSNTILNSSSFLGNRVSYVISEPNPNFVSYEGNIYSPDYSTLHFVSYNTKEMKFHPSCRCIGYCTFGTSSLENLIVPNSITSLMNWDFHEMYNLKNLTLPGSLKTLNTYAINTNPSLLWITIQEGMTSIVPDHN